MRQFQFRKLIKRRGCKYLSLGLAFYAVFLFAAGNTFAQISMANAASSGSNPGIWVQLCTSGDQIFIPLSDLSDGKPNSPKPNTHSQACHACADRRIDLDEDSDAQDS